jgi:hypothetical protein
MDRITDASVRDLVAPIPSLPEWADGGSALGPHETIRLGRRRGAVAAVWPGTGVGDHAGQMVDAAS